MSIERPAYPPIDSGITTAVAHQAWLDDVVDLQRRFQKLHAVSLGLDIEGNGSGLLAIGTSPLYTFALSATTPESLQIHVGPGAGYLSFVPVVRDADGLTSLMVAPVADDRIDVIVVNADTGAVVIITGIEDASPVAPSVSNDLYLKIGEIYHVPGETAIYDDAMSAEGYILDKEIPFNV